MHARIDLRLRNDEHVVLEKNTWIWRKTPEAKAFKCYYKEQNTSVSFRQDYCLQGYGDISTAVKKCVAMIHPGRPVLAQKWHGWCSALDLG